MREYKEKVKILRIGRQDSLRSLGGYGEDSEEKGVNEQNEGGIFREGGQNLLGDKEGMILFLVA